MGLKAFRWRDSMFRSPADEGRVYSNTAAGEIDTLLLKNLTPSDRTYVDSFKSFLTKRGYLTNKQYNFFKSVESKYSDDRIKQHEEWVASYDDEKRKTFELAVRYYFLTPYYRELVTRAKKDPSFIPSQKQFEAMCNNKYFTRAMEYYKQPPKYDYGDLVVFRKSYRSDSDLICVVEHISEEPSFTKGGRTYKLLALGREDSITVAEDEIKLYREPKKKCTK